MTSGISGHRHKQTWAFPVKVTMVACDVSVTMACGRKNVIRMQRLGAIHATSDANDFVLLVLAQSIGPSTQDTDVLLYGVIMDNH